MKKRMFVGALAVSLAAVLAAGGLLASNMGFKLNYPLLQAGGGLSLSGTSSLALPDNRQSGLNTSKNLMDDITFANVQSVSKYLEATDGLQVYTGRKGTPGADFNLATGEGYLVKMATTTNYIVVGSHDPSFQHNLNAAGVGSLSGTNLFAFPYHGTPTTAKTLMDDIGFANVQSVSKYLKTTDGLQVYTGRKGTPGADFALVPGEAYYVKMSTTVNYTPSHY